MTWKTFFKDPWFWLIAAVAAVVQCYALDWGTTNWERSTLVFQSEERLKEMTPAMIEARQELYEWIDDSATDRPSVMRTAEKPPVERFQVSRDLIPQNIHPGMLNSMRSYLLRSTDPDEQQILSSLGNMNPVKLDFDPNEYRYGGSYLYALAFLLGVGMVAGVTRLTPDLSYYFFNPDQLSRIFMACRFLGALSNVLTALLLYHWGKNRWNRTVGIIASLLYISSPLIITYGHISKPNVYSTFWLALGLYLFDRRIIQNKAAKPFDPSWKHLGTIGIVLGVSIGAFLVSGIGLLLIALWFAALTEYNVKKTFKLTAIVTIGSAIGFLMTNPYYLFSLVHVIDVYTEHTGGTGGWGYGIPSLGKLTSALVPFPVTLGWLAFIGFVLGTISDIRRHRIFALLTLICLTIIAAFMGMDRFFIPLIPLICLTAANGWYRIFTRIPAKPLRIVLLTFGVLYLGVQSLQVLTALSKDNEHRNQAGAWINQNIPPDAEVGIPYQKPIFWRTPPFAFEQYNITVLYDTETDFVRKTKPAWIVDQLRYRQSVESKQSTTEAIPSDLFEIAQRFDTPTIFGLIPAITPGYEFPCQTIVVWKRKDL